MVIVFIHVLWAAVAVYAITAAVRVTREGRLAALPDPGPGIVEVPEDLLAIAMGEQEAWAQEEVLRAIREKYELLGDWNRVRSAFGVGRRD